MPHEFANVLCAMREGRWNNPCDICRTTVNIPMNGVTYFCLMHAAEKAFKKQADKYPGKSLKLAWVKTPPERLEDEG